MYSVVYVGKDASLTLRGDHGIRINQSAHTDGQYALYAEAGAQKLSMDAEILEIGGGIKAQSDIAIRIHRKADLDCTEVKDGSLSITLWSENETTVVFTNSVCFEAKEGNYEDNWTSLNLETQGDLSPDIYLRGKIAENNAPAIDPTTRTVFLESGETESFSVRYGLYLDGAARANLKATDTVDGIDGAIMIDEVDVHQRNVRRR